MPLFTTFSDVKQSSTDREAETQTKVTATKAKTRGSGLFLLVGLVPKTSLRRKTKRESLNIISTRNRGWNTSEISNAGEIRLIFQDLATGKKSQFHSKQTFREA